MVDSLPWNLSLDELLRRLGAAPSGLSDREVKRRLSEYGTNDALVHRRRPLWRQTLDRLANPLRVVSARRGEYAWAWTLGEGAEPS